MLPPRLIGRTLVWSLTFAGILAALSSPVQADTYPRQLGIDILHYRFLVELNDTTDILSARADIDVRFTRDSIAFLYLDLAQRTEARLGRGMTVESVKRDGVPIGFEQADDRLVIRLDSPPGRMQRSRFTVTYRGQPETGLFIGPNKHGRRTFFSDNWPNRVHHWLPTVDHPGDKATTEMIVVAPAHYQVVSNGLLVEETDVGDRRLTHWRQSVPISTWLIALGAAPFAVQYLQSFDGKPVQTWVYAEDRDAGFYDFAEPTLDVLEFYDERIGPFAYEKLANVQSNSVRGGMEAATSIFYGDNSVTGERTKRWRNVIIHEIAHQWFGNAVTEADWDDVWLSEGFATYFTLLFIEHAYGRDAFLEGLESSREFVLRFDDENPDYRVRHENLDDMSEVTTKQTYEKGSWTLHMLRGMLGEDAFWSGIREYYATYLNRNATTDDFRRVMEEASGAHLSVFFAEWLDRGGVLDLDAAWYYDQDRSSVNVKLRQTRQIYHLPLDIQFNYDDGSSVRRRVWLDREQVDVTFPSADKPNSMEIDPDLWVLMRGVVREVQGSGN